MNKAEILKNYRLDKLGADTVFIQNSHFNFSYTFADSIVKEEFRGKYRYFGGLQCNFHEDSEDFKYLEKWLIEIAEKHLEVKFQTKHQP